MIPTNRLFSRREPTRDAKSLYIFCEGKKREYHIAQSYPCFEVWLYYHLFEKPATFPWIETCNSWKEHLANNIEGGFNSSKHPINIGLAMEYARVNFQKVGDAPAVGSSNVFELATVIYSFCGRKIEGIRNKI